MNQGPDENGHIPDDEVPHEVLKTSSAFSDAMNDAGGEVAGIGLLGYPIVRNDLSFYVSDIFLTGSREGAQRLQQMIDVVAQACPGTRFVLNGYSQGAWVIDCWLHGNMPDAVEHTCTTGTGGGKYWASIAGVVLYGDPQWDGNPDKGLARLVPGRALNPYEPTGHLRHGRFRSWCTQGDPVCGQGLNNNDLLERREMSSDCATPSCPHFAYKDTELMDSEGQFLASVALSPLMRQ
jgi:hypothetical protein